MVSMRFGKTRTLAAQVRQPSRYAARTGSDKPQLAARRDHPWLTPGWRLTLLMLAGPQQSSLQRGMPNLVEMRSRRRADAHTGRGSFAWYGTAVTNPVSPNAPILTYL